MAYIRDLVTLDKQAEFRNDVQLSHYDNSKINLGLVKSFIFSYNAPRGWVSAVDLLDTLRSAFTISRDDNRIVCIANYGHGKSHLALVLANYFAKPYGSPEIETVLEKLSKAVDNPTKVERFREFRQDHNEFLVIRLRGDETIGLREQFITQVQIAIQEHTATKNEPVTFWSDKALELLNGLTAEQQVKAEQFLEKLETDLAALRGDVRNHRNQGYDRTREVFKHLNGYLPDLGGEVSLQKLVKEVGLKYCGEGKPLAGMVVLFDEFSLFVQRYAQRRSAGELQDLLVGIEQLGNRAVFLAFSQHDPITVAKNYVASQEQGQSLEHELTRIPRKVFLYSLMESVIDAYLNQPDKAWLEFASDRQVRGPLARGSNTAMALFHAHYEENLRWGPEKFDEIVTRGTFPLHPLTTSMLCNLTFTGAENIGNPRTLLGFIREQVVARQDDPAVVNGQINWILPIFLVDYFKEYLGKEAFKLYDVAQSKLTEDAPPEQERLLKALLLQSVSGLKLNRDDQLSFLEEAAGIPHGQTIAQLTSLVSSQCIRLDQRRTYSFWTVINDGDYLKKKIEKEVNGKEFAWDLLVNLTKDQVKTIPVPVKWGHPEDWEAKEVILTRKYFDVKHLQELFPRFRMNSSGMLEEGVRGGVVWVIPETSDDSTWLQNNIESIVDQAFPEEFPLPVVVKTTFRTYPKLLKAYQTLKVLEKMNEAERKEAGIDRYEYQKNQQNLIILSEMVTLRGEQNNFTTIPHKIKNYIIPTSYRPLVRLSQNPNINQVLEECYRLAYTFSPPEFYQIYKTPARGTNNLWKATRLLATLLMRNDIAANQVSLRTDRIAQDILQKFLFNKWRILTRDNRICESENGNINRAWTLLDKTFSPGVKNIYPRDVLIKLLNPPYGYDTNTLTLLLSAWIGYHQYDLQFTSKSTKISIDGLITILNDAGGRLTFIGEICGPSKISISQRDAGEVISGVNQLIERINKETFTQEQANEMVAELDAHGQDTGLPEEIRLAASNASKRLSDGLTVAQEYDKAALAVKEELENEGDILSFIQLKKRISNFPHAELVKPVQKSVSELDQVWRTRLARKVDGECKRLVEDVRLRDIGHNQALLEGIKKILKTEKLEKQVERVQEALKELARQEKELELLEKEGPIRSEILAMDRRMPLATLYNYRKQLQEMQGYSRATMSSRDTRLKELKIEIEQLEKMAQLLLDGVADIASQVSASNWQETYLRNCFRYEGSELQVELDTAQDKVKKLQEIFKELSEIEKQPIKKLEDAVKKVNLLEAIQSKAPPWLGSKATLRISQEIQKAKRLGQERSEEAHQWLVRLENLYTQGELSKVIREMNVDHPYLLPEHHNQLSQLKLNVKQKQEEDLLTDIEMKFREITDPRKQRDCLARLQSILAEGVRRD